MISKKKYYITLFALSHAYLMFDDDTLAVVVIACVLKKKVQLAGDVGDLKTWSNNERLKHL